MTAKSQSRSEALNARKVEAAIKAAKALLEETREAANIWKPKGKIRVDAYTQAGEVSIEIGKVVLRNTVFFHNSTKSCQEPSNKIHFLS